MAFARDDGTGLAASSSGAPNEHVPPLPGFGQQHRGHGGRTRSMSRSPYNMPGAPLTEEAPPDVIDLLVQQNQLLQQEIELQRQQLQGLQHLGNYQHYTPYMTFS